MDRCLDVVRGKQIQRLEAEAVVRWLRDFDGTVIDLGTGDGRWAYRQAPPQALAGVADEIYVLYPWGSLLETVWVPRPEGLRAIAQLAKPTGRLEVHINASAIGEGLREPGVLAAGYAAAGIRLESVTLAAGVARTSWAGRIAHGRDPRVMVMTGTTHGDSNRHPQG